MICNSIEELYKIFRSHPNISKDSRQITENCLYFALKGENFNGNKFAEMAIQNGAAYAIIDEAKFEQGEKYILVDDVLKCLQELAKFHRSKLNIPVIGITGSNGKTTNKELIASVLSAKYNCYFTKGNYNNHIGVPLSILSINEQDEIAVIEMGANHQGEIAFLSEIADPDYGIITNIGKAHLEGFGGVEGIKKGKSELYKHLKKKNAKVFINGDDKTLIELADDLEQIKFGKQSAFYCSGKLINSHPTISGTWKCKEIEGKFTSQLYGEYNFYNILAAICIGNFFKVEQEKIDEAINSYKPTNNRSQLIEKQNYRILLDAYNANPTSMEAALRNFAEVTSHRKIIVLGDMFELGTESKQEHNAIIEKAIALNFFQIILVGQNFYEFKSNYSELKFFNTTEEAKTYFHSLNKDGSDILIKGSRGMQLEKLVS